MDAIRLTEAATDKAVPPMTPAVERFDTWLRHVFTELNTTLEEAYHASRSQLLTDPELDAPKQAILRDGAALIAAVAAEDRLPHGERERYQLLGAVGFHLAACRRHGIDGPESHALLADAWSLAHRLGASLGVAPRFVFSHQALYNPAVADTYLTFTTLKDEYVFITHNGLAVMAYQRAAAALRGIGAMGVSNPMATYLLEQAASGLADVLRFDRALAEELDADRFYYNIRPYFKSHRVGGMEYRGVNAGDFAAVNEIDLLLGLCDAKDPFYQYVLAEKAPYLPPGDREPLRTAVLAEPLLDTFLHEAEARPMTPRLRRNAELYLAVCRAHGAAYAFHHHRLVRPFLEEPAKTAPAEDREGLTASGPPLEAVVASLARLSDLRAARNRPGLATARAALDRLAALAAG